MSEQLASVALEEARSRRGLSEEAESRLVVRSLLEVMERVEQAGPPTWLIEGLWPADAYGFLGAEDKAGKTWAQVDLGVSVAAGVPWLGRFPCDPGPVLFFFGEGGERNFLRRLAAVAEAKGVMLADLMDPLRACFAVPHLRDPGDLSTLKRELDAHPARLVLLDPFYLAAAGSRGSDLFDMGEVLAGIQGVCQEAGSALAVTHHWNKTGDGSSAKRFTGVGPGAWGRVLGSAAVESSKTDRETRASSVLLRWEFVGGEIPQTVFRVRRIVSSDDPRDLSSPLHYSVEVTDEGEETPEVGGQRVNLTKRRILEALAGTSQEHPRTTGEIAYTCDNDGKGKAYGERTYQLALRELASVGLVDGEDDGPGTARRWWPTDSGVGIAARTDA